MAPPDAIASSLSFAAARAYRGLDAPFPAERGPRPARDAAPVDRVELSNAAPKIDRLTAGRVMAAPAPAADLLGGPTGPAPDAALPLYTRPADRHAAATRVAVGRVVDVDA